MKQQEIRDAYLPMKPLPGGEERMWQKIDQNLNGRGKELRLTLGRRRSALPGALTAAAVLALVLLGLLLWQHRPTQTQGELLPAATPVPVSSPVPTPEPMSWPPLEETYRQVLDTYYMVLSERMDGSLCAELGIADLCAPYIRAAEENDPLDELGYAFLEMPDSGGWAMAVMPVHGPSYEIYALYVPGGMEEPKLPIKVLEAEEDDRFSALLWEDAFYLLERKENGTGGEYCQWHLYDRVMFLTDSVEFREENGERICLRKSGADMPDAEITPEEAQRWLHARMAALYSPRITAFRDYPNTEFYPGVDYRWIKEAEELLQHLEEQEISQMETAEAMELLQQLQDFADAGRGTAADYVHILRAALHADGAYAERFPHIFLSLYETDQADFTAAFLLLTEQEQDALLPMLSEITGTPDPTVNRAVLWK